jgi:hypothetical protein
MNKKQVIVVLSAVLLFSLSELFPPWNYKDGWTSFSRPAGYHFRAPAVKSPAEMRRIFSVPDDDPPHYFSVRRDKLRLFGQRIILTSLMLGLLLVLEERRSVLKTALGVTFLVFGSCVLALYAFYVWARW